MGVYITHAQAAALGIVAPRVTGVSRGKRSGLEVRYENHLELQREAREIKAWRSEPLGFRLAPNTFYHPDFMVTPLDPSKPIQFHEVKGFWRDDARVKIKVAAKEFPEFQFIAVTTRGKGAGALWEFEYFWRPE